MKTKLYFATTNIQKQKRLKKVIQYLPLEVSLKILDLAGIPLCPETCNSVLQNARQKSQFYSAVTGYDVISQDDGIVFTSNKRVCHLLYLHRDPKTLEYLSKEEIYERWHDMILKNKLTKGFLIKAFSISKGTKTFSKIIKIPIVFKLPVKTPQKLCYNPLNLFMTPTGFINSFDNFSQKDDVRYSQLLAKDLHSLFKRYLNY